MSFILEPSYTKVPALLQAQEFGTILYQSFSASASPRNRDNLTPRLQHFCKPKNPGQSYTKASALLQAQEFGFVSCGLALGTPLKCTIQHYEAMKPGNEAALYISHSVAK